MIVPAAGLFAAVAAWALLADAPKPGGHWTAFKTAFVTAEGRVKDTGNGGISHSEGQGFAMLLATHHHDRKAFDGLWTWTQQNLGVRADRLFAWKWVPDAAVAVPDLNDAADGDLLIAWALARAGRRWESSDYTAAANAIARDVLAKLVKRDRKSVV